MLNPKQHLFIVDDAKGRREYRLELPVYVIGRSMDADIRISSQFASRRHGTLIKIYAGEPGETYMIIDGDLSGKRSANGIEVDGQKVTSRNLVSGSQVSFAPQVKAIYFQLEKEQSEPIDLSSIESTLVKDKDELL